MLVILEARASHQFFDTWKKKAWKNFEGIQPEQFMEIVFPIRLLLDSGQNTWLIACLALPGLTAPCMVAVKIRIRDGLIDWRENLLALWIAWERWFFSCLDLQHIHHPVRGNTLTILGKVYRSCSYAFAVTYVFKCRFHTAFYQLYTLMILLYFTKNEIQKPNAWVQMGN